MYFDGWDLMSLEKLRGILNTLPGAGFVCVSRSGVLTIVGPEKEYLGYIDLGLEERFVTAEEAAKHATRNLTPSDNPK